MSGRRRFALWSTPATCPRPDFAMIRDGSGARPKLADVLSSRRVTLDAKQKCEIQRRASRGRERRVCGDSPHYEDRSKHRLRSPTRLSRVVDVANRIDI